MSWISAAAIYFLFWVFSLFLVLPFGVRTSRELGKAEVPGQSGSAPHSVSMPRKLLWTTILAALLFGLFMLNWQMGWVTAADLDALVPRPPASPS